jgi:hypothetical protein
MQDARCKAIPVDARTLVEEVNGVAAKSRRRPIDVERAHGAVTVDHDDMRKFRSTIIGFVHDACGLTLCLIGVTAGSTLETGSRIDLSFAGGAVLR